MQQCCCTDDGTVAVRKRYRRAAHTLTDTARPACVNLSTQTGQRHLPTRKTPTASRSTSLQPSDSCLSESNRPAEGKEIINKNKR
jgi:hypothetical protein